MRFKNFYLTESQQKLVGYHSTNSKFEAFDHKFTGSVGFYFTPEEYFERPEHKNSTLDYSKGKKYTLKCELTIKNPIPNDVFVDIMAKSFGGNPRKMAIEQFKELGYDGYIATAQIWVFDPEHIKILNFVYNKIDEMASLNSISDEKDNDGVFNEILTKNHVGYSDPKEKFNYDGILWAFYGKDVRSEITLQELTRSINNSMDLQTIFSAASYLLENDVHNINEAATAQVLDVVKKYGTPELYNEIKNKKDDASIFKTLSTYTKKIIGTPANSVDDALKIITTNTNSEITSITNILIRAANYRESDLENIPLTRKRQELTKVAKAKGIETSGKTTQDIIKALDPTGTHSVEKSHGRDVVKSPVEQEQAVEPFPGKRALFLASYKKTLELGWPGDELKAKKSNQSDTPELESKVSGSKIPINVGAGVKAGVAVVDFRPFKVSKSWVKQAETLVYNKFKNNPAGLRKLSQAVDDIIEKNKNFKLSRRVRVRDFLTSVGGAFISRFGGSDLDHALFNWLVKKTVGVDIFEFQKAVIDKVKSSIDVSDDRLTKMENTINGVRKMMEVDPKNPKFLISPLMSHQGWDTYDVSYNVKTNMKPITDPKNIVEPMDFFLDKLLEYIKSPNKKSWTEIPSEEDIRSEKLKITDYLKNPKKGYEYSDGEDGPLSCIQEETVDKKLVGTQYMFPTFFGRGGLRITVKYKPEAKD